MQDDKFLEDFKTRYSTSKLRFDPTRTSGLINGRRWHTLTCKIKERRLSLQFYFEREKVFLLEYETPTPALF
jgi:5-keto 4-deoxyuronate isomerase